MKGLVCIFSCLFFGYMFIALVVFYSRHEMATVSDITVSYKEIAMMDYVPELTADGVSDDCEKEGSECPSSGCGSKEVNSES